MLNTLLISSIYFLLILYLHSRIKTKISTFIPNFTIEQPSISNIDQTISNFKLAESYSTLEHPFSGGSEFRKIRDFQPGDFMPDSHINPNPDDIDAYFEKLKKEDKYNFEPVPTLNQPFKTELLKDVKVLNNPIAYGCIEAYEDFQPFSPI
jgi:hypothetical protein